MQSPDSVRAKAVAESHRIIFHRIKLASAIWLRPWMPGKRQGDLLMQETYNHRYQSTIMGALILKTDNVFFFIKNNLT